MNFSKLIAALFVLTVMSVFTNTYSQTTSMGIEGGINLANVNTTPSFNTSSKTGFMVGGFADIGVSRIVSIKPAVRYILKGYTTQLQQGINLTESYSYIEIPLMIKAKLPLNQVKPYFEAGPTLGVQLSANAEFSLNGQVQDQDVSTFYSAIDFGLFFGSGVEFRVAPGTDIFTGFGYSLGLTNISKTAVTGKNNGFQISAGIKFGL
ncbi:MAG: PorT family protein [Chlorobi bacterium]|nr:PorT family protein [Chlorobiota bacterium]MCI0714744.1 PorT family protein [Chlorobiota bacterium]